MELDVVMMDGLNICTELMKTFQTNVVDFEVEMRD
jgi:hypothetical protein